MGDRASACPQRARHDHQQLTSHYPLPPNTNHPSLRRNFAWSSFQRSPDPKTIPLPPSVFRGPELALTEEGDEEAEERAEASEGQQQMQPPPAAPDAQALTQDLKGLLKLT